MKVKKAMNIKSFLIFSAIAATSLFSTWTEAALSGCLATPLQGSYPVSSNFGFRFHPTLHIPRLHKGADFAVPMNVPVLASHKGTVVTSHFSASAGNLVIIKDDAGDSTRYLHLTMRIVRVGDRVNPGTVLGTSGSTGESSGPHLHYEHLVAGSVPADPLLNMCSKPSIRAGAGPDSKAGGMVDPMVQAAVQNGNVPPPPSSTGTNPNDPKFWDGVSEAAIDNIRKMLNASTAAGSAVLGSAVSLIAEISDYFKGLEGMSEEEIMYSESTRRFLNPEWHQNITACNGSSQYTQARLAGLLNNGSDSAKKLGAQDALTQEDCEEYLNRELTFIEQFNAWIDFKKYLARERVEALIASKYSNGSYEDAAEKIARKRGAAAASAARKMDED